MLNKLPDYIDPIASVNHQKHYLGAVEQAKLKRLVEAVIEPAGEVKVDIKFYFDKAVKFPAFEMKLETQVLLECQRSLKTFSHPVKVAIKGVFTESMSIVDEIPSDVEIFELDSEEERISLYELVEEELLLAVPMIPVDESAAMAEYAKGDLNEEVVLQETADSKPNPFAALKALKNND